MKNERCSKDENVTFDGHTFDRVSLIDDNFPQTCKTPCPRVRDDARFVLDLNRQVRRRENARVGNVREIINVALKAARCRRAVNEEKRHARK